MDTVMYESLINRTKAALSSDVQKEINKSNFYAFFTSLLEDCSICVCQSLESAVELLCESNVNIKRLIDYIEDTVCLLRLMSNFIKNVVESISMSCCTMKSFPTTTGNILVTVFKHCKDSEQIYGGHLGKVGKQLKDLFRTCHELQITYLMILEKHFLFDLVEEVEQDVLINALQVNLEIGEIVQGLDVKTLAEQWKAFTTVCEKYATFLIDRNIYNKCTQVLCTMINDNIANSLQLKMDIISTRPRVHAAHLAKDERLQLFFRSAFQACMQKAVFHTIRNALQVQMGPDEKVVVRSLKVTSFIIKLLLKVTNIFRNASTKKHENILETLITIYMNNEGYLELDGRPPQFINLIKANVLGPTDLLLGELLQHESFAISIFQFDVSSLRKEEKLLGYVILLISMVKHTLLDEGKLTGRPPRLIKCIFECVPYCHTWFSMPLKFDGESINSESTYGLYEYLLTHAAAVSLVLNSEELSVLEKIMCESLLGNDSWKGLFASNLWVLVARMSSQNLIYSQLISLCGMYQKLQNHYLFANSPQKTHLTATITRLFELLDMDSKINVLRQFSPIYDEKNINLWISLKMNSVSWDIRSKLEEEVIEKCKLAIDNFCMSDGDCSEVRSLIKILHLLATFSITVDKMDEHVIKAWARACLRNNNSISKGDLARSTIWYLEYLQAVIEITYSMKNTLFANPMNLLKVLHVISTVILNGNTELRLLLIEPLFKYATFYKPENKSSIENLVSEAFVTLFHSDDLVKGKLFSTLYKYKRDVKMDKIISLTVNQDNLFRDTWNRFLEQSKLKNFDKKHTNERLQLTMGCNYSHRCLDNDSEIISFKKDIDFNSSNFVKLEKKTSSQNFDFVDVDDIFGKDNDEPTSKKMKYTNEANDIVCRIENDTMLLYKVKENIFDTDTKRRIKDVCDKLRNIIE